ncbi:MAG: hypothetical protein R3F02_14880 [Thiolinea sp.]
MSVDKARQLTEQRSLTPDNSDNFVRTSFMFKFLPGLILLQCITITLLLLAPDNLSEFNWADWAKIIIPLAISALLMAFWFSSLSAHKSQQEVLHLKESHAKECEKLRHDHQTEVLGLKEAHAKEQAETLNLRQDEILRLKEAHAAEREKIRVSAERAKHRVTKEAQKQVEKEIRRTSARANFKVGAAVTGAIGLGGLLVLTQFVTLGALVITTAGGTLGGYLLRYKQEKKYLAAQQPESMKITSRIRKILPKP